MTSTRDDSSSGAATLPRYGYVPNEPNTPSIKAKERSRSLKINLLVHILWLALPLYFYGRLLTSDAYRRSVNLAKSSPALEKFSVRESRPAVFRSVQRCGAMARTSRNGQSP